MIKKIFLISTIICTIFFSLPAFAAHTVPKLSPLQPIPQGVEAPTSQNINSQDSATNKSLQLMDNQTQAPAINQNSNPANQTQTTVPANSGLSYWILLFVGILGLGSVLIWAYVRFGKL